MSRLDHVLGVGAAVWASALGPRSPRVSAPTDGAAKEPSKRELIGLERTKIADLKRRIDKAHAAGDKEVEAMYKDELSVMERRLNDLEELVIGTDAEIYEKLKGMSPHEQNKYLQKIAAFKRGDKWWT